ncbi:MAG: hypothetical protein IPK15_13405 [Verrucomicrobia bacterium]|nr:hypothetical protein [Verrucomicrobiota bacterium]
MNIDPPLKSTPTHAAQEYPGTFLGIEIPRFLWVSGALLLGFALFAVLNSWSNVSPALAASVSLAPAVLVAGFILVFLQNRPPGYARDLIESWLNRGHHSPARTPVLCRPLPDTYLTHGLILNGGPRRGGQAARRALDRTARPPHRLQRGAQPVPDSIRQLLRLLPPGYSLEVCWWADSEYRVPLRRYQEATRLSSTPLIRRTRNAHFLWNWQQMERRQLRRERVAIVLCRSLAEWPATPWTGAVSFYEQTLQQLAVEFGEVEKQVAAVFAPQGGRSSHDRCGSLPPLRPQAQSLTAQPAGRRSAGSAGSPPVHV